MNIIHLVLGWCLFVKNYANLSKCQNNYKNLDILVCKNIGCYHARTSTNVLLVPIDFLGYDFIIMLFVCADMCNYF